MVYKSKRTGIYYINRNKGRFEFLSLTLSYLWGSPSEMIEVIPLRYLL